MAFWKGLSIVRPLNGVAGQPPSELEEAALVALAKRFIVANSDVTGVTQEEDLHIDRVIPHFDCRPDLIDWPDIKCQKGEATGLSISFHPQRIGDFIVRGTVIRVTHPRIRSFLYGAPGIPAWSRLHPR